MRLGACPAPASGPATVTEVTAWPCVPGATGPPRRDALSVVPRRSATMPGSSQRTVGKKFVSGTDVPSTSLTSSARPMAGATRYL